MAASYVIGWNVYGYVTIPTFGNHVTIVFYTNWSYLVLGLHLTLALLITLFHYARRKDIRGASNQHPCVGPTNGSHVIATWCRSGAPPCGTEGTAAAAAASYIHSQECPQVQTVGVGGKRKQRALKYNNNEYIADDNHRKRHPPEGAPGQCNGMANGKRRSKVRDHVELIKGAEGDAQVQNRQRSVGVLCAGISASQAPEGVSKRVINEGRSRGRHAECNGTDDNARHAHTSASRKSSTEVGPGWTGHSHGRGDASTPDSPPRSGERKQRRRRHVKVCHRGGRAVAFKCRSSTSSLDKIRSKGRRLTSGGRRRGSRSPHGGSANHTPGSCGRKDVESHRGKVPPRQACQKDMNDNGGGLDTKGRRHKRLPARSHEISGQEEGSWIKPRVCSTALPFEPDDLEFHRSRSRNRKHTIILHSHRKGERISRTVRKDENVTVIQPRMSVSKSAKVKARNSLVKSEEQIPNNSIAKNTRSIGTNTSDIGAPASHRISYCGQTNCPHHRPNETQNLPLYIKVSWVVFNIAVVSAPVVSAVYFFILFPMLIREEPNYRPGILDINLHGINSVIVFLEISLSAIPVRILHFVYPLAYGITYVLFSIAYWALDKDNNILYPVILDWNNPGIATAIVIGIVLFATPLFQCTIFSIYRLRLYIYRKIYSEQPTPHTDAQTTRKETDV